MGLELIPYDQWDVDDYYDQERLYVDINGEPITGILENFFYFSEGDPRNNQEVKDGKRV